MRKFINSIFRKKPVDKKSAARPAPPSGFSASRQSATAMQNDDSPAMIAVMHDLSLDNYRHYPEPSWTAPAPIHPSPSYEPPAPSYDSSSSYDSGSSSSSDGGSSGGGD